MPDTSLIAFKEDLKSYIAREDRSLREYKKKVRKKSMTYNEALLIGAIDALEDIRKFIEQWSYTHD